MNPELQNKIDVFTSQVACTDVDFMMLEAINKIGDSISELEMKTLFTLYETSKNVKAVEEFLINELTRLGVSQLKEEIENCVDVGLQISQIDTAIFPNAFSEAQIIEMSSLETLPKFASYEDFQESDFFQKYYSLGPTNVRIGWFWGIQNYEQTKKVIFSGGEGEYPEGEGVLDVEVLSDGTKIYTVLSSHVTAPGWDQRIVMLMPARIPEEEVTLAKNLQRMLLVLGYLTLEDFDISTPFGEGYSQNETDISYFGILGGNDKSAVRRFQSDMGIDVDSIVGPNTKRYLFYRIFEVFHKQS